MRDRALFLNIWDYFMRRKGLLLAVIAGTFLLGMVSAKLFTSQDSSTSPLDPPIEVATLDPVLEPTMPPVPEGSEKVSVAIVSTDTYWQKRLDEAAKAEADRLAAAEASETDRLAAAAGLDGADDAHVEVPITSEPAGITAASNDSSWLETLGIGVAALFAFAGALFLFAKQSIAADFDEESVL